MEQLLEEGRKTKERVLEHIRARLPRLRQMTGVNSPRTARASRPPAAQTISANSFGVTCESGTMSFPILWMCRSTPVPKAEQIQ